MHLILRRLVIYSLFQFQHNKGTTLQIQADRSFLNRFLVLMEEADKRNLMKKVLITPGLINTYLHLMTWTSVGSIAAELYISVKPATIR